MDDFDSAIASLQPQAAPSSTGAPPPVPTQPAPIRTNNQGSLMPGGKMASFSTPEQGLAAMDANLSSYGRQGVNTLAGVISKWAPQYDAQGRQINDTPAYIADVSRRLSLDPNQVIDLSNPNVRHALGTGIMLHESGPADVFGASGAPKGGAPAPAPAAAPATPDEFDTAIASLKASPAAPASGPAPGPSNPMAGFESAGDSPPMSPAGQKVASYVQGALELGAGAATAVPAKIAGGLAGLATAANPYASSTGGDTVRSVENALTYQPTSQASKDVGAALGRVGDYLTDADLPKGGIQGIHNVNIPVRAAQAASAYGAAADYVGERSPTAGAVLKTAPTAAGFLLPGGPLTTIGKEAITGAKTVASSIAGQFAKTGAEAAPAAAAGAAAGESAATAGSSLGEIGPTAAPAGAGAPGAPAGMSTPPPSATAAPEASKSATAAAQSAAKVPYLPTVDDATPDMRAKIVKAQASGDVNPTALGRHLEANTLPVPVSLSEGQATGDAGIISEEQNTRALQKTQGFFQQQNQALTQNGEALRAAVAPDVPIADTMADHGQALIDMAKAADAPELAQVNANYAKLRAANGGDLPIDGQQLVANVQSALKQNLKTGHMNSGLQSALNEFADGSRQMNFEDWDTLRTDAATVMRTSADGNQRAAAGILRQQLDNFPLPEGATQDVRDLADVARQSAAARFAKLRADPAYAAAVDDATPMGEVSPLADNFAKNYVLGGNRANLTQFQTDLAYNPLAQQRISAIGMDSLRDKAGIDMRTGTGNFMQKGYNGQLEKLHQANKVDNFFPDPQINQQVNSLGNVARYTQELPTGHTVSTANSLTAALPYIQNAAEMGTNLMFKGVPVGTAVRKGASMIGAARAAKATMQVGAGLKTLGDVSK
jgi:hypothetical protein